LRSNGRVRDGTDIRQSLTLPIPKGWAPSLSRKRERGEVRERPQPLSFCSMARFFIVFCSFSKARTSIWRTRSREMP